MKQSPDRKILVIHGPNMNLIGVQSAQQGTKITLDKIDRALREKARELDIKLKILQTHDEAKAVTFLQRNRNKTACVLIAPTSWHNGGVTLADTLQFLQIPHKKVSIDKRRDSLFDLRNDVFNENPIDAYTSALETLIKEPIDFE